MRGVAGQQTDLGGAVAADQVGVLLVGQRLDRGGVEALAALRCRARKTANSPTIVLPAPVGAATSTPDPPRRGRRPRAGSRRRRSRTRRRTPPAPARPGWLRNRAYASARGSGSLTPAARRGPAGTKTGSAPGTDAGGQRRGGDQLAVAEADQPGPSTVTSRTRSCSTHGSRANFPEYISRQQPQQLQPADRVDDRHVEQPVERVGVRADPHPAAVRAGVADRHQHRLQLAHLAVEGQPVAQRARTPAARPARRGCSGTSRAARASRWPARLTRASKPVASTPPT